jgi:hypothetical protein
MKKLFLILMTVFVFVFDADARDGFAIVIDKESYIQAKNEVDNYAATIEKIQNLKVYLVIDRWGVPDSIRAELIRLHTQKKEPILGTVLIGDIPVAMIRDGQHMTSAFKMDQKRDRKESSVPSDRYYDDFGLKFKYIDQDKDAPYFYYSVTANSEQRLRPDIYSGRIRPTDNGGVSRYTKLKDYLVKLVKEKNANHHLKQMFYFSGHGYISESKVARIDEKAAFFEHFPSLKGRVNAISYMDHTDQNPVKERVMNELMRNDLDLAILHHHGYWDTEYFNNIDKPQTINEAKEFIKKYCREHILAAKQRKKDYEALRTELEKKFDLPKSWLADALDSNLTVKDSLEDAAADLHIEDFKKYGYQPNTPVVVIDACFCGSFHLNDCIADEYIFQPGRTVVCIANSVNVLQDKWSDRFIGLIGEGGCVGDVVRYSTYLESHVIGDPTFRFCPDTKSIDIDHVINENKVSEWKKLLKNGTPDAQSLAIEHLSRLKAITSEELKTIYEDSPYGIVRLQALMSIADFKDDNFIKVVEMASQDSYELLQRQAIRFIARSGDERLIPALIKLAITNNTSDRCNFNAKNALSAYPKDKLLAEFARQYDNPSVCYMHKDSIGLLIKKTIEGCANHWVKEIKSIADTATTPKNLINNIRLMRNNCVYYLVPELLDHFDEIADPEMQVALIEALGWHGYSVTAPLISERALKISQNEKYKPEVRNEALKTYNRINEK